MKKIISTILILCSIVFAGCKNSSDDPKSILISFFEALSTNDIKTARKYATAESKSMLDLLEKSGKTETTPNEKFKKENLEFGDIKIEGDKAIVPVTEKASGVTVNYVLKNEQGWKVAFDKATMMNIGNDVQDQHNNDSLNINDDLDKSSDIDIDSLKNEINSKLQGLDTIAAKSE